MNIKLPLSKRKRIEIAKDVIKQIKARKYKPESGVYLSLYLNGSFKSTFNMYNAQQNAQTLLKNKKTKCNVCAIGALLCSYVNLFNEKTFGELTNETNSVGFMNYFGMEQGRLIESAFEGWDMFKEGMDNPVNFKSFRVDNPNDSKRMIIIMKNIIRNRGTFIP